MKRFIYLLTVICSLFLVIVNTNCSSLHRHHAGYAKAMPVSMPPPPATVAVGSAPSSEASGISDDGATANKIGRQPARARRRDPDRDGVAYTTPTSAAMGVRRSPASVTSKARRIVKSIKKAVTTGPVKTTAAIQMDDKVMAKAPQSANPGKDAKLKPASLGLSYSPTMKLGETKTIIVRVDANHTQAQVAAEVRHVVKEETGWLKTTDSTAILTTALQLYDSLRVSLICDTADFQVKQLMPNTLQKIDLVGGNQWEWEIKAISPSKHQAIITLNVNATTPDAAKVLLTPRDIPITIYFDFTDVVRGWVRYSGQHPEYTVPSIVVPLIVTAYNVRKKRRQKRKAQAGNV
jgi:hypothetical protein